MKPDIDLLRWSQRDFLTLLMVILSQILFCEELIFDAATINFIVTMVNDAYTKKISVTTYSLDTCWKFHFCPIWYIEAFEKDEWRKTLYCFRNIINIFNISTKWNPIIWEQIFFDMDIRQIYSFRLYCDNFYSNYFEIKFLRIFKNYSLWCNMVFPSTLFL